MLAPSVLTPSRFFSPVAIDATAAGALSTRAGRTEKASYKPGAALKAYRPQRRPIHRICIRPKQMVAKSSEIPEHLHGNFVRGEREKKRGQLYHFLRTSQPTSDNLRNHWRAFTKDTKPPCSPYPHPQVSRCFTYRNFAFFSARGRNIGGAAVLRQELLVWRAQYRVLLERSNKWLGHIDTHYNVLRTPYETTRNTRRKNPSPAPARGHE